MPPDGSDSGVLSDRERAELGELRQVQPGLWLKRVDETRLVLQGRLSLNDTKGEEVDSYLVEIRMPRVDGATPDVFERGSRIPCEPDRHIFSNTGACCTEFPVEYLLRSRQRLVEYVNGQVVSFFIAQSHFEHFGRWPHGELGHGMLGVKQFCAAHFGDVDVRHVAAALELLDLPGGKHRRCPCQSGRKFFQCHRDVFKKSRAWPSAARWKLVQQIRAFEG